jgi:hypothetical protein
METVSDSHLARGLHVCAWSQSSGTCEPWSVDIREGFKSFNYRPPCTESLKIHCKGALSMLRKSDSSNGERARVSALFARLSAMPRAQEFTRASASETPHGSKRDRQLPTNSCARRVGLAIVMAGLATIFPSGALAQSPTEENRIYFLKADGTLTELPQESGMPKSTRSPGMIVTGAGKSKTFTEISGQATIRIGVGTPQMFVIGTSMAAALPAKLDPYVKYAIVQKFDLNKKTGNREWLFSSTTGGYVYFKHKGMSATIPLNFERYSDHAIKVQPRLPLEPGEYGFLAQPVTPDPYARAQVYYRCFGID